MTAPPLQSARAAALKVLGQAHARRADAAERLGALLETTDRAGQATDLVYGVMRNAPLLDRLLKRCADIRKANVKPALWNILRLGVYELVYAPLTADYAILNEAVDLAGRIGSSKSGGFVNAVLRSVQRQLLSRQGDRTAATAYAVPRADQSACVFALPVLPDPSEAPLDYLHTAWSLPLWLVRDWAAAYGPETAARICRACNRHPSVTAWPNTQRITAQALGETLAAEGLGCRLWADTGCVQIHRAGSIRRLDSFKQGLFYIQDPAAHSLAAFLDPSPGDTLVDLCAAPGGKTLALALHIKDNGAIAASDASAERLKRVEENVRRLGLGCVRAVSADSFTAYVQSLDRVDAVIVDVPCSNTGVLARRVEARRRLERRPETAFLKRQQSLLADAASLLRSGGRLLYSTCSIQPEENEHQIRLFLSHHPEFLLTRQHITLPSTENAESLDHDGGFLALMKKR